MFQMNNDAFMAKARAIVSAEIDSINVKKLADKFGYDSTHFCRKMKAINGYTPSTLIQEMRMEKAKELLTTKLLVKDIGYTVGYSTPSHFIESFRKHFGVTPDAFRKK